MTTIPVRLEPWMEAVGLFYEMQEENGCLVAKIGPAIIALPYELEKKLKDCMGQRIGILRTDTDYRFRILE